MTNDLISREMALELARNHINRTIDCNDIARIPAVDAAPVVHASYGFVGPHIGSLYADHGTCGNCKERILIDPQHKNFCPHCGAKMDGDS